MVVLRAWIRELRAPFLVLPLLFVLLGTMEAWRSGFLNFFYFALTLIGVVSLHASANVLNDYFDFESGIDVITKKTPFSGGSGMLPSGRLVSIQVKRLGSSLLAIGIGCGLYLLYARNFDLVLLMIFAATLLTVYFYSHYLASWSLGEFVVFLDFGPLLLLGVYYVQARTLSLAALTLGAVTGLMTAAILYANEFPDYEADRSKGRRNLVVRLGKEKAARFFKYLLFTPFSVLILGVVLRLLPIECLLALFAIPVAAKSVKLLQQNYSGIMELIPAMASTIKTTILTAGLLLVGYVVRMLIASL